jgi:two-component system, sensor histidine kinase
MNDGSMRSAKRPSFDTSVPAMRPLRVLVIDDSAVNRHLLTAVLRDRGHIAVVVKDGNAALEAVVKAAAVSAPFDVILVDIHMPNMDGFETLRLIRSSLLSMAAAAAAAAASGSMSAPSSPSSPTMIYAMTGDQMPTMRNDCLAEGFRDVLIKPFHRADVLRLVESAAAQ